MLQPPLGSPGQVLRDLWNDEIVVMPGAHSALTARLAWKCGAKAVYLSGGAIANDRLGAPDIAITTLTEVADVAARAVAAAPVPIVCDADTGFGDVWNTRRTVIELERAGLAGIHIEDQVSPKRCGHLAGKELIPAEDMAIKIRAAVGAKRQESFVVIARTDARAVEGLDAAIKRANAYLNAGADAIFPEGLQSEAEFDQFAEGVDAPLLANMTEFGVTPLIAAPRFQELGYKMVIFPVTALRVAMKAVGALYADLLSEGTQRDWLEKMITREELYELVDYAEYER